MIPFQFAPTSAPRPDERRVVVPAHLESKNDLFAILRDAIPLPAYFGNNWDALDECLGSLDWMAQQNVALIHEDIPMKAIPSDQKIYLQILVDAAHGSERLRVIFPERDRQQVERLLIAPS